MSSLLHNPGQVIDQIVLQTLNKEISGDNYKSLSRADSFARHMAGG